MVNTALLRQFFESGATRSYAFRKQQLQNLRKGIQRYEDKITAALYKDLHKNTEESYTTEIGFSYTEISYVLRHLKEWMQPQKVDTPLVLFPSSSKIVRDPFGIAFIVAPWNYPFQLCIAPLIGAIAGGNCAIVKPSEFTPHTSAVVKEMIESCFPENYIKVVEGDGAEVVPYVIASGIDYVFFTGSIPVGRIVAKQAADKLIPYTLELGGKSPCIVDEDADIKTAAARIVWGKFTNAGQTCVAPDYLLCHANIKDRLLTEIKKCIEQFYSNQPSASYDYGRIVNAKHFQRLVSYLHNGTIIYGGETDEQQLYIQPTILDNVTLNDAVMQEEIFGPIFPVISFNTKEEALALIKQNHSPLALYIFSNNKKFQQYFTEQVSFGGGCINNTLVHLGNAALPFGGVGNSGSGQYHGRYSFECFTRPKSILQTANWLDPSIKYPPYKGKLRLLKMLMK